MNNFWWKHFGGKGVENIQRKLVGGKYLVEWEGHRLLTRPAEACSNACIYQQTFNMADRGSYACIYGGKLMVTSSNQATNEYRAICTGQADIYNLIYPHDHHHQRLQMHPQAQHHQHHRVTKSAWASLSSVASPMLPQLHTATAQWVQLHTLCATQQIEPNYISCISLHCEHSESFIGLQQWVQLHTMCATQQIEPNYISCIEQWTLHWTVWLYLVTNQTRPGLSIHLYAPTTTSISLYVSASPRLDLNLYICIQYILKFLSKYSPRNRIIRTISRHEIEESSSF